MDDQRLLKSDTDAAEAVERIAEEFRAGFAQLAKIDRPAVTMFGSARLREGHPSYEAARAIGRRFAEPHGWPFDHRWRPGLEVEAG